MVNHLKSITSHVSYRARKTPPSPIRRLAPLAAAARARGVHVYGLNIGQPDLESPSIFFDGLGSYRDRVVAYEDSRGRSDLREAWARYNDRVLNLQVDPEHYLITMGASEALIFLFMICCDPGDEIIIFDPTYANYQGFAAIAGVKLVPVHCEALSDYPLPSLEVLESYITSKTRAILLCNPNNPTGRVYNRAELEMLFSVCETKGIFFIVDETYREFVFDGRQGLSILHVAPDSDKILVVDSLSKRFSLCGARIGCLITRNDRVLKCAINLAQARLAAASIDQHAAAYMLDRIGPSYVDEVRAKYEERRDVLYSGLQKINGVSLPRPGGAFYTLVDLPVRDAEAFCRFLLERFSSNGETVFLAPGSGFYFNPIEVEEGVAGTAGVGSQGETEKRGASTVRVAYVLEPKQLERAMKIVEEGLDAFLMSSSPILKAVADGS